jgi:hypothetical protein
MPRSALTGNATRTSPAAAAMYGGGPRRRSSPPCQFSDCRTCSGSVRLLTARTVPRRRCWSTPVHVRGGLIFTTEIVITPRQQLQDARLYLDDGWFAGMTVKGIARRRPTRVPGAGERSGTSGRFPQAWRTACGSHGRPTPRTWAGIPQMWRSMMEALS